ncbi:MAG: HAMP domain-containing histidine kinase [Candidatus Competibacteraceae bacterium]|nr:HAMP domain-containing histidine kinase [Candidatus Competibacteraceae bacterium]
MTRGFSVGFFHNTVLNFITVLILSFIASALLFWVMSTCSDSFISRYVRDNNLVKKEATRIVNSLQSYINEEKITIRDIDKLDNWSRLEKYMHLIVFQQGEIIYDSDVATANESTTMNGAIYSPNYTVSLLDFTAPIYLDSFYEYRFYDIAVFTELVLSFFLFTFIVVLFVARHLAYIRQIAFGIEVLEGGDLEYEIPVRGNDELASLANSLNSMRKVFLRKNDRTSYDARRSIEDLAVISHDLRTPLTTLILFIEIIKTKKDISDHERDYYTQKLSVIANKIRVLAENIEDFSSADWQHPVAIDSPRPATEILQEVLPEAIFFLEERGFTIVQRNRIKDESIRVNNHLIYRIIDNVVSNIDRYAAHEQPVTIETKRDGEMVFVSFSNTVAKKSAEMKTSKLGLSLVKEMMIKMNGKCMLTKRSDRFVLKLGFPLPSEGLLALPLGSQQSLG